MNNIRRAYLAAQKVHANQSYDIYPYMYHIEQVVDIATELGYEESIIIGAYLHDSMEDGDLSYNDIKKAFGSEVAEIVYAVTDELGRNRTERKEKTYPKIRSNWKALAVKICDRIANVKQSKEYNPRLFEMYKKEHPKFEEELRYSTQQGEVDRAWNYLEEVLEIKVTT